MFDFAYWSLLPTLLDGRVNPDLANLVLACREKEAFVEAFCLSSKVGSCDAELEDLMKQLAFEKLKMLEYSVNFTITRLASARKALEDKSQSITFERCLKLKLICDALVEQISRDLSQAGYEESTLFAALRSECSKVLLQLSSNLNDNY